MKIGVIAITLFGAASFATVQAQSAGSGSSSGAAGSSANSAVILGGTSPTAPRPGSAVIIPPDSSMNPGVNGNQNPTAPVGFPGTSNQLGIGSNMFGISSNQFGVNSNFNVLLSNQFTITSNALRIGSNQFGMFTNPPPGLASNLLPTARSN